MRLVKTEDCVEEDTDSATDNAVASKRDESVARSTKDASREGGHDSSKRHLKNTFATEGSPKAVQQPDIEGPIRQMLLSARMHRSQKVIL